jgi:hypothetical protein
MMVTKSDTVASCPPALSLNPFQNASSRLTLVLRPATTIDRFTIGDFMACAPRELDVTVFRSDGSDGLILLPGCCAAQ